jgi:hypothetical protein
MRIVTLERPIAINITVGRALRLKELGLLDILAIPGDVKQLTDVLADPMLFTRVLWECTDQNGMTFEAFAALFTASDLEQMGEAFTREVIDFFPEPIRNLFANAIDQQEQDQATPGSSFGDSRDSSASIRDLSHYANSTIWVTAGSERNGRGIHT